jgi:hypothetical protein
MDRAFVLNVAAAPPRAAPRRPAPLMPLRLRKIVACRQANNARTFSRLHSRA